MQQRNGRHANGQGRSAVIVADSQRTFSEALAVSLSRRGLSAFDEFPTTAESVVEAAARLRPDAILLDYWIVGVMNGVEAVRAIRESSPRTVVLMLSWVHGGNQIDASLAAGAVGFLPKSLSVGWVAEGIQRALAGESPVYADELKRLIEAIDRHKIVQARDRRRLSRLSAREVEVMTLLAQGYRPKDVAARLFLGIGTVENHVHRILKKLGVTSSHEALQMARRCAWAPLQIGRPPRPPASITGEAERVRLHVVPDVPPATASPRSRPISVLVADEQRLMAEPLAEALDAFGDVDVVGAHVGDGHAAVQAAIKTAPDIVLYDYWMPGTNGPAATRYLAAVLPRTRVLLLSWLHGRAELEEAREAGAAGFVPKTVALKDLVEAIRSVHARRDRVARDVAGRTQPTQHAEAWDRLRSLTPRELMVLHMLCERSSVKAVAEEAGLAEGTVRNYVQSILRKTGASTKAEAVDLARRHGLARETGPPPFW